MNTMKQQINVTVDGGYQPQLIELKQGIPAELTFTRTNAQGCLDVVHSNELGFNVTLPLNQPQTVQVATDQSGDFKFSCGMDMFEGKVVIKP